MLQAGRRLRKSTRVMAGTGDRSKSSTLPILLPDSRCRRMCCVIAGVSLARRPVAAAFDAFGGWCFVGGEFLGGGFPGGWPWNWRGGQYRLAGLDARNVKNQDLTPNTRSMKSDGRTLLACERALRLGTLTPMRSKTPRLSRSQSHTSLSPMEWESCAKSMAERWLKGLKVRALPSAPVSQASRLTVPREMWLRSCFRTVT